MIEELSLWAAQDALLGALADQEALDRGGADEVALDLGFPADIAPEHVWIDGGARGSLTNELTGTNPSDEQFRIKVFCFVQSAEGYDAARDRLKTLATAVEAALASDDFAAAVDSWTIPGFTLDSGTDGSNRQLCLELTVECRCW
jgi:hypothetical protein